MRPIAFNKKARVLSCGCGAAAIRHLQLCTCQPKAETELPSSKTGVTFQDSVQPSLQANWVQSVCVAKNQPHPLVPQSQIRVSQVTGPCCTFCFLADVTLHDFQLATSGRWIELSALR